MLGPCRTVVVSAAARGSRRLAVVSAASPSKISGTAAAAAVKAKRQAKRASAGALITVRPASLPHFHIDEAILIARATGRSGAFDSTVNLQVQLGIDPRRTDSGVRGVASMPHGTGARVVVAVFAKGELAEEARRAGASIVGDADLVERIARGDVSFTKTIATPDMMPLVGRVARILGPRGLMPNPKLGTVTVAVREAVTAALRGQAEFRSEKRGIVAAGVGKASFTPAALRDNTKALLSAIFAQKPEGFKGVFVRAAFLGTTHGPSLPLDLEFVDPVSPRFFAPGSWNGLPQHCRAAGGAGDDGAGGGSAASASGGSVVEAAAAV